MDELWMSIEEGHCKPLVGRIQQMGVFKSFSSLNLLVSLAS